MQLALNTGGVVEIDEDDHAWAASRAWRLWRRRERQAWIVVSDHAEGGLRVRLNLHREIAFRMRPDLLSAPRRLKVVPKNGNYLDVRRVNLELLVQKARAGRPAKGPTGYAYRKPRRL